MFCHENNYLGFQRCKDISPYTGITSWYSLTVTREIWNYFYRYTDMNGIPLNTKHKARIQDFSRGGDQKNQWLANLLKILCPPPSEIFCVNSLNISVPPLARKNFIGGQRGIFFLCISNVFLGNYLAIKKSVPPTFFVTDVELPRFPNWTECGYTVTLGLLNLQVNCR